MISGVLFSSLAGADDCGPNIFPAGQFNDVTARYVPWAGVDDNGNIHGLDGEQLGVGDDGNIAGFRFGPSIAVGDLNGDGKPDLVLADSKGFFWFYPNSGTKQKPMFTQGEIMPIWLAEERTWGGAEGVDNVIPRIQLVDFDNNKRLDLVAGTYAGKLFHIPNVGSPGQPDFRPTYNRDNLLIKTHKSGMLWCNYLAPFFTSLFGSPNSFDLVLGDGSYSANSIYLLKNTDSGSTPAYDEDHLDKIIPGMGLEQLTPAVVDWNNDGKPDIICGDRTGYLTLYLNNSTDTDHPTFAPGTHVKIAGMEKLGRATTVAVGDLTGNHLPNLLIGTDDGTILYALNSGTLGAPAFTTTATPNKGVLPQNYHYTAPNLWSKDGAWGAPDELLACVSPALEQGFKFPEGETSQYALKFGVWPVQSTYFTKHYYPPVEDDWREHFIGCVQGLTLDLNKRYRIHFWVKADKAVSEFRFIMYAAGSDREGFHGYDVSEPIGTTSDWTEFSSEIKISNPDDPSVSNWSYIFQFHFKGQSTFYIDDLQIQEETN